ncbi:MAG: SPFH domain-containing protein [Lachnospiraceae bacterium]|nr:SPFH domain-containing protein [Lachnospiraceae bacterium]
MGLISTAIGSVASTLKDTYKEYFYCDAMPANVLMTKGKPRGGKGTDNIITTGSIVAVADGQAMMIVDQGKIAEFCAEPGEFVYDASTEPSIFAGSLGSSILETFKTIGKRITFGGTPPKDQRVYYVNTKEIMGNKYGTPSPIPFRVIDERARIDIDVSIRCNGEYSYRVSDPILFYTNVAGNVTGDYTRDKIDSTLKTELLTALQPAFAQISVNGVRYSQLPGHTKELADALNNELSEKWQKLRGLEIVSFGVNSVNADPEDEKMLKEMQRNAAYTDASYKDAMLAGATGDAMKAAANNANGAAMGFMGMNMAGATGMANMNPNVQGTVAPAVGGAVQGAPQGGAMAGATPPPAPQMQPAGNVWTCECGKQNQGKFCAECGKPMPVTAGINAWTCACGHVNQGKFCAECGKPKPAGIPQYKCDKCGWEPEDPQHPPKFCPECGDPFDDGDIVNG